MDYIIILHKCELDVGRFAVTFMTATLVRDSLYTFRASFLVLGLARDCPSSNFLGLGFPRIHLIFHPKLL